MGRPKVNLNKALLLADQHEDDAILDKMEMRK